MEHAKKAPLATLLSCGNLLLGLGAVVAAARSELFVAALLVALAAALDLLDGAAARRKGADGEFGASLDSLADLVSFGVAPALALYFGADGPLAAVALAGFASALFVVAGALRLARFPLVKNAEHFVGLPIPPAGAAVALLAALQVPPVLAAPLALALAALMVGRFRFPTVAALPRSSARRSTHEGTGKGVGDGEPSINPSRNG